MAADTRFAAKAANCHVLRMILHCVNCWLEPCVDPCACGTGNMLDHTQAPDVSVDARGGLGDGDGDGNGDGCRSARCTSSSCPASLRMRSSIICVREPAGYCSCERSAPHDVHKQGAQRHLGSRKGHCASIVQRSWAYMGALVPVRTWTRPGFCHAPHPGHQARRLEPDPTGPAKRNKKKMKRT
jgi:hypothetical protein